VTGHPPNTQFPNALAVNGIPVGPFQHAYLEDGVTPDLHGDFFVLGADRLGRDVLVRVLYGARISLIVAFGATSLAVLIGTLLGLLGGFYRGSFDAVVGRMVETAMAFPALLLAVGLSVVIGPGLGNVLVVIALFSWFYPARIVRAVTLRVSESQFVEAARMLGAGNGRILARHVVPQVTTPLLVYSTSIIAANILFEAGLSYVGVGVPLPTASWGQMLSDGVTSGLYRIQPSLALVPGIALVLTMLAFNLLGDGMREALEGRSSR
jgi:peptide/nickel transport system permease protein